MDKDKEVVYGEPLWTSSEDGRCYDSVYEDYKH